MSISNSKPYHHGNVRGALIEAAVAALQVEGVQGLSLRKLAAQIGVSHNAPYMHFPDKEALLAAVAEDGFTRLAENIQAALDQSSSAWLAQLEDGCIAYVRFMRDQAGYAQVMFSDFDWQKYPTLPRAAGRALGLLEALIQSGQAAGLVAPGSPRQQATLIWSLLQGIATMTSVGSKPPPGVAERSADDLTRDYIRSLYAGLQPR